MEGTVNVLYGVRYLLQDKSIWCQGVEAKDRYYIEIEKYLARKENVCHMCLYGMIRIVIDNLYPTYSREKQRILRDNVCQEICITLDIQEKEDKCETLWRKIAIYNDKCTSIEQIRYIIDTTIDYVMFMEKVSDIFQE